MADSAVWLSRRLRCVSRWLTGLALGAAGCVVTDYQPDVPPAFLGDEVGVPLPPANNYCAPGPVSERPRVLTLPDAIRECITANLRVLVGAEKIHLARADLMTESIIPNSQLFTDYQLIPLQNVDINNQAGPPQFDVLVTIPVDWLLFGKRTAAIAAAKLNVDVSAADLANLVRQRVSDTVSACYDVLEARELLRLAEEDLKALKEIEEITKKQVGLGGVGAVEVDRAHLAVLDAQREARRRDSAVVAAKMRLRPLLGRSAAEPDFEVQGTLAVTAVYPAPALADALALAEANRPDLISDRLSIEQAAAALNREQRKAYPQVSIQPGYSRQIQSSITGFRDASLFDIGLTTTLPITDRNQGNIAKAVATMNQNRLTLAADRADIHAEVEQALDAYQTALTIAREDDPATIKSAQSVRDRIEESYKLGGRRLLEVLDAQRAYRDRQRAVASGQAELWRTLNRLNAAVGLRAVRDGSAEKPK